MLNFDLMYIINRKQYLGWLLQFFILETLNLLREKKWIHQFPRMIRRNFILTQQRNFSCMYNILSLRRPLCMCYQLMKLIGSFVCRCDLKALEDALCKRVMITPEEVIKRSLDPQSAVTSRDGLAKTVYSRLFDW